MSVKFAFGYGVFAIPFIIKPTVRLFRAHPVNKPDPIRVRSGSAGKHWPEAGTGEGDFTNTVTTRNDTCIKMGAVLMFH